MNRRHRLGIALAALLSTLPAATSPAQEPAPLYVSFDFADYPSGAVPSDCAAGCIAARLAPELGRQGRLPYWRFAVAGPSDYPRLAVRVEEQQNTGDYELVATLHLAAGDAGHGSWRGTLITLQEQLEEDGFPAPSRAPDWLVETFVETVLTAPRTTTDGGDMFERLTELVPVARVAHLERGQREALLGLDRSRYGTLALSTFRLLCEKENGTVVALYSKGSGERGEFPDPPFPAIVVRHDRWEEGTETAEMSEEKLAALGDLQPQRIFLDSFDPDGLVLDAGGDGGDDLPPPTIATDLEAP